MNTNLIEGYDQMTTEQKLKALEDYEPDMSGYVEKSLFDKTASDVAKWKKKFNDTQDAETQKKQEEAEKFSQLQASYEALLKESTIAKHEKEYLALGYDPKLASRAAKATYENDSKELFKVQKEHLDAVKQQLRKAALNEMPEPTPGKGETVMTREKLAKMDMSERAQFYNEHPDQYKELMGY